MAVEFSEDKCKVLHKRKRALTSGMKWQGLIWSLLLRKESPGVMKMALWEHQPGDHQMKKCKNLPVSVKKSTKNKTNNIFLLPQKCIFCLHLLYR